MRVAALTMVFRDHWFLRHWIGHYGRLIGRENLHVVSHGDEPAIRDICDGCTVIPYARDTLKAFDRKRWALLSDLCGELLGRYDAVIVGDVDEVLLPLDPGQGLVAVLREHAERSYAFAAGFDLLEHPGKDGPLVPERSVFAQRRLGKWARRYSKAVVAYEPVRFRPGAHRVMGRDTSQYCVLSGAVLAHLKYANSALWAEKSDVQAEIVATREDDFRWDNLWHKPIVEGDPAAGLPGAEIEAFEPSLAAFRQAMSTPIVGRGGAVGHQRFAHQPFFTIPEVFEAYL